MRRSCRQLEGGAPDFATMHIRYVPGDVCVELKSLKLYLWSFRNDGIFYERAVNRILDDLARRDQARVDGSRGRLQHPGRDQERDHGEHRRTNAALTRCRPASKRRAPRSRVVTAALFVSTVELAC